MKNFDKQRAAKRKAAQPYGRIVSRKAPGATLMGDPQPGRSALDRRLSEGKSP